MDFGKAFDMARLYLGSFVRIEDNISANIDGFDFSKSWHTHSQKDRTTGLWKGF